MERVAPVVVKAAATKAALTPVARLERYVGRFRSAWGDMQILARDSQLVAIYPNEADPWLDVVSLTPVAEHSFRMQGQNGYAANGELAVFEFDTAGKVTRLRTGDTYTYPVERW